MPERLQEIQTQCTSQSGYGIQTNTGQVTHSMNSRQSVPSVVLFIHFMHDSVDLWF